MVLNIVSTISICFLLRAVENVVSVNYALRHHFHLCGSQTRFYPLSSVENIALPNALVTLPFYQQKSCWQI